MQTSAPAARAAAAAVFLDKDGTLLEDDPYNVDPARLRFASGAAEALRLLRRRGYRLVVVSNQAGIARGVIGEAEVRALRDHLLRDLQLGRPICTTACTTRRAGSRRTRWRAPAKNPSRA